MADATIVVRGDKTIIRQLRAASRSVTGGEALAALLAAAEIVKEDAQNRAPFLTGELREKISVATGVGGAPLAAHIGGTAEMTVYVISAAPHARRIELGFTGTDKLGRMYHDPPRPYLRPAVAANRNAVRAALAQGVRDAIRKSIK